MAARAHHDVLAHLGVEHQATESPVCRALKDAADAARAAGRDTIDQETLDRQSRWYANAAATGIALNARRKGRLQEKRHALATRMSSRADDYLRYARDLRVPFDNYPDAAVMPMFAVRGGPAAGQGGALAG